MRPEAKVQRPGNRSAPDFSWLFASSAMYVASLTGMTREKRTISDTINPRNRPSVKAGSSTLPRSQCVEPCPSSG